MPPRCPKCKGMLRCEVEYVAGGDKLKVIKCINCGNRVASRPYSETTSSSATPARQPEGKVSIMVEKQETSPKPRHCKECDRDMPLVGQGLCGKCYYHLVQKPAGKKLGRARKASGNQGTPPCADCGRSGMRLPARGLCATCWNRHRAAGTLEQYGQQQKPKTTPAVPAVVETTTKVLTPEVLPQVKDRKFEVDFSPARESELYQALAEAAAKERRSLDQQILCILEEALFV